MVPGTATFPIPYKGILTNRTRCHILQGLPNLTATNTTSTDWFQVPFRIPTSVATDTHAWVVIGHVRYSLPNSWSTDEHTYTPTCMWNFKRAWLFISDYYFFEDRISWDPVDVAFSGDHNETVHKYSLMTLSLRTDQKKTKQNPTFKKQVHFHNWKAILEWKKCAADAD